MSKIIICSGTRAKVPYHMELTGTNLYSIEELCYYINQNIYMMSPEVFTMELADFMEQQLNLPERANKLRNLIRVRGSLKDLIVCILCSCDYFMEMEIKDLIRVIDEISELTVFQRQKLLADQCLNSGNYIKAKKMYQDILNSPEIQKVTEKEQGSILHNMAVTLLHLYGYDTAVDLFGLAYEHNHNMETLRQYLLALKCAGRNDQYEQELQKLTNGFAMNRLISEEIAKIDVEFQKTREYEILEGINQLRKERKTALYQREVGQLLSKWKETYRQQNVLQER